MQLTDDSNFRYNADIDLQLTTVAEAENIQISWADVTQDLLGHPMAPETDINAAALLLFGDLTEAEIELALATDNIEQSDIDLYLTHVPDGAECELSDFTVFGSDIDAQSQFTAGSGIWMLVLATLSADAMPHYRRIMLLEPSPDGPNTATLDATMGAIHVSPDLHSAAPLAVPVDQPDTVLDWSGLTTDGTGNAIELRKVDRLGIARYDMTVSEVEDRFVDLHTLTSGYWEANTDGRTSIALSELTSGADPFPGITQDGTWAVAMSCSTCNMPMPLYMAVLSPE